MQPDAWICLQALVVDFQPAGRMAELGKIAVKRGDAAAEDGALFEQDDVIAAFGGLERGGDSGNAAADDENGLTVGPAGHDDCVLPRLKEKFRPR